MKTFGADLHIHTALSPCADDEMTPPAIVNAAVAAGLHMIGVCDHNCAANAEAMQRAARGKLAVVAGIEITTAEDAHVLGLFGSAEDAVLAGERVGAGLPLVCSARGGQQLVLDEQGRFVRAELRALSQASQFDLASVAALIHEHGGLAVASHIDRPTHSVLSQFQTIPPDASLDALELSAAGSHAGRAEFYEALGYPLLVSSDSHFLCEIGSCRTFVAMDECSFAGLADSLRETRGQILEV